MRRFVRHLPVHGDDAQAGRIGWVPAPHVTAPGPIRFAIGHTRTDLLTGGVTPAGRIETKVVWLGDGEGEPQLAVMNAEQPIDAWREVPGFLEERRH